jgi:aminopeptidase-like protein
VKSALISAPANKAAGGESERRAAPPCRSITRNGVRRTLDLVEEWIPLERTKVPTGTKIFDWQIPGEWNIRDAYIAEAYHLRKAVL